MIRHSTPLVTGASLPSWWEPLHRASPGASVFVSAPYMQTWLEIYGGEFRGEWLHWEDAGEVVGGCLLLDHVVRKRGIALRTLFLNATGESERRIPLAEFNDIVCRPGFEEPVADDLAKWLAERPWDCLCLSGCESGSVAVRLESRLASALVRREESPARHVDLARLAGAPYEATLSANTRQQLRRSRRLYEERSGPMSLRVAESLEVAVRYLAELVRLSNSRWKSKGEAGSFESSAVGQFHERLVPRLWEQQAVDLIRVSAGETEVGYLYNFRARGKVYFFQSGFVYQEDQKLKPGLVAHALAIEHYALAGLKEYDFLAIDARYKRSLAKDERTLHWTTIYRDRMWIRFLIWMWKAGQRLRGKVETP